MLEFKSFNHKLDTSVRQALLNSRLELLPDDICDNPLVKWLIRFDDLSIKQEGDIRKLDQPEDASGQFIGQVLAVYLQRNLPFYFAALFHIGRQWKVSNMAINAIRSALEPQHLVNTVEKGFWELHDRRDFILPEYVNLKKENLYLSFQNVLSRSLNTHGENLSVAKRWWDIWKEEVHPLYEIVEKGGSEFLKDRKAFYRNVARIMIRSASGSQLATEMSNYGFYFKEDVRPNPILFDYSGLGWIWMLAMLGEESEAKDIKYVIREWLQSIDKDMLIRWEKLLSEWQYSIKHLNEYLKEVSIYPAVQRNLDALLKKYGEKNPFDRFKPLRQPASWNLIELYQEHILPNGDYSFYIKRWLDQLKPEPDIYPRFDYISSKNKQAIIELARSADSTIKRAYILAHGNPEIGRKVGETDSELIQRIFERQWLSNIVRAAVRAKEEKEEKVKNTWSFENLSPTVLAVIRQLNKIGYRLQMPYEELELAWKYALMGKSYWDKW